MARGKKQERVVVNGYVDQECYKAVTGRCVLDRAQRNEIRRRYEVVIGHLRLLIRILLAGYEGRDDSVYEELSPAMSKEEFFEAAIPDGLAGLVGRAIFPYNYFIIEIRPLHKNTFNRLSDKSLMVIGYKKHADFWFF